MTTDTMTPAELDAWMVRTTAEQMIDYHRQRLVPDPRSAAIRDLHELAADCPSHRQMYVDAAEYLEQLFDVVILDMPEGV